MSTIVVTKLAVVDGHEVPVEALVFARENLVIYSRMLVDPRSLPHLPPNVKMEDIHFSAVMN